MPKKKLDKSWLTEEALELLDENWRYRLLLILQDIPSWPQLKYAYAISLKGTRLSYPIGPDFVRIDDNSYSPEIFFFLAGIIEDFLTNIDHPSPAQVTIELEHEILYIASCGELYLVASFYSGVPKGYMSMKLTKRINHLRHLWRKELSGSLAGK